MIKRIIDYKPHVCNECKCTKCVFKSDRTMCDSCYTCFVSDSIVPVVICTDFTENIGGCL